MPDINFDDLIPPENRRQAPQQQADSTPSMGRSAMLGAAQGLTFGFGDEIWAGLKSFVTGRPYGDVLKENRQGIDAARAAHPVAFGVGEFTGAIPTVALPGANLLRGGSIGKAILGGAAAGAVNAFGNSQGGLIPRLQDTPLGAGLGAVGGAVAAPLGALANTAVRKGMEWAGGRGIPQALQTLAAPFRADNPMRGALAARGPEAMLADAGPNMAQRTAGIYTQPGPGRATIGTALDARFAGGGDRVRQAFDDAFGSPAPNVPKTVEMLMDQRSQAAAPLYSRAYATQVPWSDAATFNATTFGRIVNGTPAGRMALARARRLAQNEGLPITPDNIDIRALDYVKRGFDDMITSARRQGNNEEARAITRLREQLVNGLDGISPEYRMARAAYAGPSAALDALEQGQSAFSRLISPDQMSAEMAKMSGTERDAYVLGARAWVEQMMGTARNDAGAAIRELSQKGWNREKLELLLGRRAADDLLSRLDTERVFQGTNDAVRRNSLTAERIAAANALPGTVQQVRQAGSMQGLLMSLGLQGLTAGNRQLTQATMEKLNKDAAEMLMATGARRDFLEQRLRTYIERLNRAQTVGRIGGSFMRDATVAGTVTQGREPLRITVDQYRVR